MDLLLDALFCKLLTKVFLFIPLEARWCHTCWYWPT